ncbi:hypothetical protein Tco_0639844 [Tanacetum coccineum]
MSTQQYINAIRAQRLANTHDHLALRENTKTPFHLDQSSLITYLQHPQPNNNFVHQPSFNTNYMQQPMQNPEDISDLTTAIDMALALMAKAFTLNDTTPTNNNRRSSSNPSNMQIAQPGINMDQDRQMLMVEDNNVGNFKGLSVDPGIANQYGIGNVVTARAEANVKPRKWDVAHLLKQTLIAQKEEAGIQLTSEEFDFMAAAGACKETERENANYTLENNLQQASTTGTQSDKAPIYDSDGSAEVPLFETCYDNDIFNMFTQEEQYTELLELIPEPHQVQQNDSNVISAVSSVEQGGGIVEQHSATVEETRKTQRKAEADESLAKHKALELEIERLLRAVVSQDIMSIVQNNSVVDTSNLQTELEPYNDMQQKIEQLQAQLGDQKGKSKDTQCVSERKDTTKGTSVNTQFCKQSILGKPPSSSGSKLYSITPFPKSKGFPKINESHALSKPVTSNSVPTPTESKVVKNDNVIFSGIFRMNPIKASRVDNFVANKHVKAIVRTKPITVSQPHVITKNDVNSKTNGFSPKDVKSTTRTRRPLPRNNTKNDKNDKSEVVCAMCNQNRRDLPRNTPLDRVEVLGMIGKRSKVRMGIISTEAELALEQSQQGVS